MKSATKGARHKGPMQPGSQGPNAKPRANMSYTSGKVSRKANKASNTTGKGAC